MRCVECTFEYLDGLALVALLRANDLDAHLFNENFVRQDWLYILAYGGFRVMVPASQLDLARSICDAFRAGALALTHGECERPGCPRCGASSSEWNSRPRDWFRVAMICLGPIGLLPLIFGFDITHKYRCQTCSHRWLERPVTSFGELQARADAALTSLTQ